MLGMMGDKKNIASLIVGDIPEVVSGPEVSGCEACAEDILKAIESKDSKALAMAFKAMISMVVDESSMEG